MNENFELKNGIITKAKYIPSPNYNHRPKGIDIDVIIIHNISLPPGQYSHDYVSDFFTNKLKIDGHPFFETIKDKKVSSHLYIRRNGELIQYVPIHERAWHAGASTFKGRSICNDFSIGIELEGCDYEPFNEVQYQMLNTVIKTLRQYYPKIIDNNIVGHSDVAPGRKTDPGPFFEWGKIAINRRNKK